MQFVRATVAHVAAGAVTLTDGRILTATHILLTTGSTNRSDSTGLIARRSLATLAAARHTRLALTSLPPGARVSVVGAGLTGLETATEIAEARPQLRVRVVSHGPVGAFLPDRGRHHLERTLERLGIDTASTPEGLILDCTGFAAASLARDSGLPCDHRGALRVTRDLAVPGHPGLWGAGDAVAVDGWAAHRMGCAVAEPMGAHAADAIDAALDGRTTPPFGLGFTFCCVSLGRRDGLIVWTDANDVPTGRVWTGRLAALTKESVCRLAAWAPGRGATLYRWRRNP